MFCRPISNGVISANLATQNATITLQFENIESAQVYYSSLLKDCPVTLTSATLLAQIPDAVMIQIFQRLSYIDLHNVSKVSKEWRKVSLDNKLGLLEWVRLVKTVMPKLTFAVTFAYWNKNSLLALDIKTHYITFPINSDQKINIVTEKLTTTKGLKHESIIINDPIYYRRFEYEYIKPNESHKYDVCIVEVFTSSRENCQKEGIYTIVQNSSLPMNQQKLIQEVEKFVNEFAKDVLTKRKEAKKSTKQVF